MNSLVHYCLKVIVTGEKFSSRNSEIQAMTGHVWLYLKMGEWLKKQRNQTWVSAFFQIREVTYETRHRHANRDPLGLGAVRRVGTQEVAIWRLVLGRGHRQQTGVWRDPWVSEPEKTRRCWTWKFDFFLRNLRKKVWTWSLPSWVLLRDFMVLMIQNQFAGVFVL